MLTKKHVLGLTIFGLLILVFFPRVLDLDATRSPDEKRWVANTAGFTRKLAHGQWHQLLQQPHPGITTQWLGALTISSDDRAVQKLPIVVGQGLLILAIGYIFMRLRGKTTGLLVIAALTVNPLLYAHSRVYAMDSLLALFLLASLGLLLQWHKERHLRYLIAAGLAGAAALLSKLPGVLIIPFSLGLLLWWDYQKHSFMFKKFNWRGIAIWSASFLVGMALILPSFALAPMNIIGDFAELFRSDDYGVLHQFGSTYYLRSLVFFSSPVHWVALVLLGILLWRREKRLLHEHLLVFLLFATLFTIEMTLGAKKGDRYILPTFVSLDIVAAFIAAWLIDGWHGGGRPNFNAIPEGSRSISGKPELNVKVGWIRRDRTRRQRFLGIFAIAIIWQATIIWQSHPHTLAYINPITAPLFEDRRHGWGEGLDLAAAYLNEKEGATDLKVASYYPNEFGAFFVGETVPVHKHDAPSVDYVVLYRAMYERGSDAWETDVLQQYASRSPEKVIQLSGLDFIWIYPAIVPELER